MNKKILAALGLNIQDLQMFGLILNKLINFHPFEIVGRGSETQLPVPENLNYLI